MTLDPDKYSLFFYLLFPSERENQAKKWFDELLPVLNGDMAYTRQEDMVMVSCFYQHMESLAISGTGADGPRREASAEKEAASEPAKAEDSGAPPTILERLLLKILSGVREGCEGSIGVCLIVAHPDSSESSIIYGENLSSHVREDIAKRAGEALKHLRIFTIRPSEKVNLRDISLNIALFDGSLRILERLMGGVEEYYCEVEEEKNYLDRETLKTFRHPSLQGREYLEEIEKRIRSLSEKQVKLSLNAAAVEERLESIRFRMATVDNRKAFLDTIKGLECLDSLATGRGTALSRIAMLEKGLRGLSVSLHNAQIAVVSMRTDIELYRSSETSQLQAGIKEAQSLSVKVQEDLKGLQQSTLELQKEGIFMQTAAGFIEFILIFYYSLGAWHLIHEEQFKEAPSLFRFFFGFFVALSMVGIGHFLTVSLKERRFSPWLIPCITVTVVMIILAVYLFK